MLEVHGRHKDYWGKYFWSYEACKTGTQTFDGTASQESKTQESGEFISTMFLF